MRNEKSKGGAHVAEVKEAKAIAKYVRIAPRKVRIVMDLIRGKDIADAFAILKFTPKRGATLIEKVLKSAVANAENNFDMDADKLFVSTCFVDQGPTMKRYHPRSRGQAFSILKHTSHITVVVSEKADEAN
jgi:large subunit ribosomal protein L22